MQVNVIALDETSATFETELGTFTVCIASTSCLHLGACGIELSIATALQLGVNAETTDARIASITNEGARIVFVGQVEQVDADGVGFLRLMNALVMIETLGVQAGMWVTWTVHADAVRAWGC